MKPETILKICFFAALAIGFSLVVWIDLPKSTKMDFEQSIRDYQGLLLSVGTLFLISLLALAAAQISSSSAERREIFNRRIQAELQIAQFRQTWIKDIRDDLAELNNHLVKEYASGESREIGVLLFSVQIRLNPKNDEANEVRSILTDCIRARANKDRELFEASLVRLQTASERFLKAEWDRLKSDLESAQQTGWSIK